MNSIIEQIDNDTLWLEFLEYKRNQMCITKKEIEQFEEYILNKKYYDICKKIKEEEYIFDIPEKHLINKIECNKKRVIYSYKYDENIILKFITYLFLKKYDCKYSDNCYSFRKKYTVKSAVYKLSSNSIKNMYGYKLDISNYFNSIDVTLLLDKLKMFLENDDKLFTLISNLLLNKKVKFNDKIIEEDKGIMAGIPVAAFLANIFLYDLDEYFKKENVIYIRYSDDIIIFSDKDEIDKYMNYIYNYLELNKLYINPNKIKKINPGDSFEFLGFSYKDGIVDISFVSKKKIKGKIRRKANKLRRWMLKNNVPYDKTIKVMNRVFNRKFYKLDNTRELTWALWYFPVINTSSSLKEIDLYVQQYLRYIVTGRFNKKNYNIKYNELKKLGYKPLVNEYYKFKKQC